MFLQALEKCQLAEIVRQMPEKLDAPGTHMIILGLFFMRFLVVSLACNCCFGGFFFFLLVIVVVMGFVCSDG